MSDLVLVQFGDTYEKRTANTLVDILERTFSNISTIFAWAKRASYQVYSDIVPKGGQAGVETAMMFYDVPANTLAKDGYNIKVEAWGTFAANANNKQLKMYFGSSVIYDTGTAAANGGTWKLEATITRTGAATEQAITFLISSNTIFANSVTYVVPTETLSGIIEIKCSGLGVSNNDVVENGLLIKIFPQV